MSSLVSVSLALCCSTLGGGSPSRKNDLKPVETKPITMESSTIEITFEGLMIFHKEAGNRYEIGILKPEVAPGHKFQILVDEKPIDLTRYKVKSWILEITGRPGSKGPTLRNVGHNNTRLMDSQVGQYDFSWSVDLESKEFHGHELKLRPNKLWPIIHLPDGDFYTKYKSPFLDRKQDGGAFSRFGFVAETTALEINLQQGEELVLKESNTGPEGVILRLGYDSHPHTVDIHNSPIGSVSSGPSHFKMYYQLFTGVAESQKFDFRFNPETPAPASAFNPYPVLHIAWVGSLPCGAALLGTRTTPLE